MHRTQLIGLVNRTPFTEAVLTKSSHTAMKHTTKAAHSNVFVQKVNMIDLESALSYMLRHEVSRTKIINRSSYEALVQWLTVLVRVRDSFARKLSNETF